MRLKLLAACAALWVGAPGLVQAAPAKAEIQGHLQAAEKVTDRVHVMRQPNRIWSTVVGNVTIIEQSDGVVLFDTGATPGDGERVAAQVRAITRKPVKAVVLSHWHNDHPLGLSALLKHWPDARIIATAGTTSGLTQIMGKILGVGSANPELDGGRRQRAMAAADQTEALAKDPKLTPQERDNLLIEARYIRARAEEAMGGFIVLPTETVTGRLVIEDRLAPVELHFLGRANTDGDLVAWLPRQKTVLAGDVVVAPVPYGFNSYPGDWIEVLKKIKAWDFAILVPGHGAVQRDGSYVDQLIAALSDVRTQVSALAAQGLTQEEVAAKVDHSRQTAIFAKGDPWAARLLKGFWLDPITSSAFREAKGVPIKAGG